MRPHEFGPLSPATEKAVGGGLLRDRFHYSQRLRGASRDGGKDPSQDYR
jgi:hypothetical protein